MISISDCPANIDQRTYNYISIEFAKNSAKICGSTLYGGLLDRCTLDPKAASWLDNNIIKNRSVIGPDFFNNVSDIRSI